MTKFTEHLWDDIAREHGATLAVTGRAETGRARLLRRPRVLAGSTLGLAGVGTALVLALGAASSSPAYAVATNGDGSVLVTINQDAALPQANAKLAEMGIDEQVTIYVVPGAAAVSGPVTCTPAAGENISGPQLKVLLGKDGTQVVGAGQTGDNTGVGTYHLGHCVVTGAAGAGSSGNTGNTGPS
jgi:hypothetical protein